MVFQSYALWPHMTVEQNVGFGLQLRKIPGAERSRRIAEALAAVHMSEYAARRPNQLSGGQQQRVALARALVIRPDVLLLDEPLSNLDAKLRTELRSEIRRICKNTHTPDAGPGSGPNPSASPITTIYVTHDQKEALSMADRMAVLDRGRIVALGTPRDLYRRPPSRFVAEFLGETNFIPCSASGPGRLETPAGPLTTSGPVPAAPHLVASVRPEAFRIIPADAQVAQRNGNTNLIPARILESTYLGEIAHHTAELQGGVRIRIADLNPAPDLTVADHPPRRVNLDVAPDDVVVLAND
jgi:iron(III) transport system ATP-binding protein